MKSDQFFQRSTACSFGASCCFHGILALFLLLSVYNVPAKRSQPRLLVHTVKLSPRSLPQAATPVAAQMPVEPAPRVEKEEVKEEKHNPDPVVQEEKSEILAEASPAATTEEVHQEVIENEEKTVVAKPTEVKQKSSRVASQSPKKKTPPSKKKAVKSVKKAQAQTVSKKTQASQPSYNKKLVAEALQRLNKSRSVSSGSVSKESGSSGVRMAQVGSVGHLNSEEGVSLPSQVGDEAAPPGSPEAYYVADLIRRLQLHVRLVEPGEVRVSLTLSRKGSVIDVSIVSCKSSAVKKNIGSALRSVPFSAFGSCFRGENEHKFLLRLSNDLVWSCT